MIENPMSSVRTAASRMADSPRPNGPARAPGPSFTPHPLRDGHRPGSADDGSGRRGPWDRLARGRAVGPAHASTVRLRGDKVRLADDENHRFSLDNTWFAGADAVLYALMLRATWRPGGWSSAPGFSSALGLDVAGGLPGGTPLHRSGRPTPAIPGGFRRPPWPPP